MDALQNEVSKQELKSLLYCCGGKDLIDVWHIEVSCHQDLHKSLILGNPDENSIAHLHAFL